MAFRKLVSVFAVLLMLGAPCIAMAACASADDDQSEQNEDSIMTIKCVGAGMASKSTLKINSEYKICWGTGELIVYASDESRVDNAVLTPLSDHQVERVLLDGTVVLEFNTPKTIGAHISVTVVFSGNATHVGYFADGYYQEQNVYDHGNNTLWVQLWEDPKTVSYGMGGESTIYEPAVESHIVSEWTYEVGDGIYHISTERTEVKDSPGNDVYICAHMKLTQNNLQVVWVAHGTIALIETFTYNHDMKVKMIYGNQIEVSYTINGKERYDLLEDSVDFRRATIDDKVMKVDREYVLDQTNPHMMTIEVEGDMPLRFGSIEIKMKMEGTEFSDKVKYSRWVDINYVSDNKISVVIDDNDDQSIVSTFGFKSVILNGETFKKGDKETLFNKAASYSLVVELDDGSPITVPGVMNVKTVIDGGEQVERHLFYDGKIGVEFASDKKVVSLTYDYLAEHQKVDLTYEGKIIVSVVLDGNRLAPGQSLSIEDDKEHSLVINVQTPKPKGTVQFDIDKEGEITHDSITFDGKVIISYSADRNKVIVNADGKVVREFISTFGFKSVTVDGVDLGSDPIVIDDISIVHKVVIKMDDDTPVKPGTLYIKVDIDGQSREWSIAFNSKVELKFLSGGDAVLLTFEVGKEKKTEKITYEGRTFKTVMFDGKELKPGESTEITDTNDHTLFITAEPPSSTKDESIMTIAIVAAVAIIAALGVGAFYMMKRQ